MSVGAILNRLKFGRLVREKDRDMVVERNYEGAWVIYGSDLGYLVTRRYYGYTRGEAMAQYRRELKALRASNA